MKNEVPPMAEREAPGRPGARKKMGGNERGGRTNPVIAPMAIRPAA